MKSPIFTNTLVGSLAFAVPPVCTLGGCERVLGFMGREVKWR